MPRNGSGTYSLPTNTWNPAVDGVTATSTDWQSLIDDVETALTASVAKDGQTAMTGNLPMGGNRLTGVGAAVAITDSARPSEIQSGAWTYLTGVAGVDTITASLTGFTAYAAGNSFRFVSVGANTGAVTLNINSVGAKAVTKNGTTALAAGDIPSGAVVEVAYDGTRFQLTSAVPALSTPVSVANGGTASTTAIAARNTLGVLPPVRQTVLNGPVDSSGLPNFGGSTGSTTVTTSGTLVVVAAQGTSDRWGSVTNPSWTGLSTNGTMYLYLDVAADGSCTTGSTTLEPTYRWGGADVTTNNQNTFNIQEMTMKVGNGSAATAVYRVFVGQVTVAGGVVTVITWYALMGRYYSTNTGTPGTTRISFNHNIGCMPRFRELGLITVNVSQGYAIGEEIVSTALTDSSGGSVTATSCDRLTGGIVAYTSAFYLKNKTTGALGAATVGDFDTYAYFERGW